MPTPRVPTREAHRYATPQTQEQQNDWKARSGVLRPADHEVQIQAPRPVDQPVAPVRMATILAIQSRVIERQRHVMHRGLREPIRELEVAPSFEFSVADTFTPGEGGQENHGMVGVGAEQAACSELVAMDTVKDGLVVVHSCPRQQPADLERRLVSNNRKGNDR